MNPWTRVLGFFDMSCRNIIHVALAVLLVIVLLGTLGGPLNASEDECERTSHMGIYSNAAFIEEAGDVVGYELAVEQLDGTSATALLHVYEGVPNKDGTPWLTRATPPNRTSSNPMKISNRQLARNPRGPRNSDLMPDAGWETLTGTVDSSAYSTAFS